MCSCIDGLLTDYIYDDIEILSNGMSKVKIGAFSGIIDRSGTNIIPPMYNSIEYVENSHIYIVQKDSKMGIVDLMGAKIVDFIFDKIQVVGNDIFLAKQRTNKYFINKFGERIFDNIELDYLSTDPIFEDGICNVTIREVKGWLDSDGNLLENPYSKENKMIKDFLKQFERIVTEEHFGITYYRVLKWGKVGFLDEEYNVIMPCVYDYTIGESIDNNIIVKKDGFYGLFNLKLKKETISCSIGYTKFEARTFEKYGPQVFRVSKHVLAVGYKPENQLVRKGNEIVSGKTEVWDLNYNVICDQYSQIETYTVKENLIKVKSHGLSGFVNSHFKEIIPCMYDHIFQLNNNLFWAQKGDKVGIINNYNRIIIPFEYDGYSSQDLNNIQFNFDFGDFSCGLLKMRKAGLWGYINITNQTVIDFKYIKAGNFNCDGIAEVHPDDGCIDLINTSGKVLKRRYIETTSDPIIDDDYIRDGLREAFNDDSDAYWNID